MTRMSKPIWFEISFFRTSKRSLENSSTQTTLKTCKVQVIAPGFYLVVVLFTLQVHQVQLVDESMLFQQLDGPIDRSPVDLRLSLARQLQQRGCVEMFRSLLNHFE